MNEYRKAVNDFKKKYLEDSFRKYGTISKMARKLNCPRTTINTELKKLGIEYQELKRQSEFDKNFLLEQKVLGYLLEGDSIDAIRKKVKSHYYKVMDISKEMIGKDFEKFMNKRIRREYMQKFEQFDAQELIQNSRDMVYRIMDALSSDEFSKLPLEEQMYAKFMVQNKFMNTDGTLSDEGKEALLH